jgi:hypothetical protein
VQCLRKLLPAIVIPDGILPSPHWLVRIRHGICGFLFLNTHGFFPSVLDNWHFLARSSSTLFFAVGATVFTYYNSLWGLGFHEFNKFLLFAPKGRQIDQRDGLP